MKKQDALNDEDSKNDSTARTYLKQELIAAKNAYNELLGHEECKMLAFDDVPVFELTIDENANITGLSGGVETVTGYSSDELIGYNFADILADYEQVEEHIKEFIRFRKEGCIRKKRWRMLKKTGEVINVIHSARAEYDSSGRYIAGVGFVMDISDAVNANDALLKSEKEKSIILNAMSEGVIYFDPDKKVIWANKIISGLFNIPMSRMKGKSCVSVCPGMGRNCSVCILEKAIAEKIKKICELSYKDRTLAAFAQPVLDSRGAILSIVMVVSDITDRRLLETQIVELSNNERQRIAYDLHDRLGQMLTAVSMMSSSLLSMIDKNMAKEYSITEKIVRYTGETQTLMRNILYSIYPIHGGSEDLSDSLARLAVGVSATYNIVCIFETEGVMKFEDQSKANHLFLIVQEAVNNAVKHSKCTKISIKSEACKGKNVISISDDGEGLNGSSNGGHGFRIMHYRASVIGAELCIGNSKKGTVVSISFDS